MIIEFIHLNRLTFISEYQGSVYAYYYTRVGQHRHRARARAAGHTRHSVAHCRARALRAEIPRRQAGFGSAPGAGARGGGLVGGGVQLGRVLPAYLIR